MYTFILNCRCLPIYIFIASDKSHDLYVDSDCLNMFNVFFGWFFFGGGGLNILPLNKNVNVKTRYLQLTCVLFQKYFTEVHYTMTLNFQQRKDLIHH